MKELDFPGAVCFVPGVVSGLLALQWGGTKYDWDNKRIIALFVVCGVLCSLFVFVQWWRQDRGTIPPRVIKNRNMMGSAFFAFCIGGCYYIFVYFVSFSSSPLVPVFLNTDANRTSSPSGSKQSRASRTPSPES